jgi:ubiquitin-conjugating enzyme E2 O
LKKVPPPFKESLVRRLILDQYILFENRWVGQIDEVVQDITLRLSNNTLVQVDRPEFLELATNHGSAITDQSLFISDKFVVGQHVVGTKSNLRRGKWILGEYTPDIEPHGIVVDVRTRYLTVNWVAQRYQGSGVPAVQFQIQPSTELYPEEDAVVVLADVADATAHQIGDRVRFLDRGVETEGYGGVRMDRREFGGFDGNVWMVVGTETFVDVDWQDGTRSAEVPAKDLRMYLNIDEYEGWPVNSFPKSPFFVAFVLIFRGTMYPRPNPTAKPASE